MADSVLKKRNNGWKDRLRHCAVAGLFALAIVAAALVLAYFGHGIPCVFHLITGFNCPGCGVTRMIMALLEGQFAAAFKANAGIMLIALPLTVILIRMTFRYIKTGQNRPTKGEKNILLMIAVFLVGFGIMRNIM